MKAYVINLPQSVRRRVSMNEQLQRAGLRYELVNAVDGRALPSVDRSRLVDEAAVERFPQWLTPPMIGCALSHLRVYEHIIGSGRDVGLVLEDDVKLPPGIAGTVDEIASHMKGSEVVLLYFRSLGVGRLSGRDSVALRGGMQLLYPISVRPFVTTAAYLITSEACRRLAEVNLPVRASPDSWGDFYELGAIDSVRCVVPRLISTRAEFKSTITNPVNTPVGRTTDLIVRRRIFPLFQLLTLNRYLIERKMSGVAVVDEQSPVAVERSANTP